MKLYDSICDNCGANVASAFTGAQCREHLIDPHYVRTDCRQHIRLEVKKGADAGKVFVFCTGKCESEFLKKNTLDCGYEREPA